MCKQIKKNTCPHWEQTHALSISLALQPQLALEERSRLWYFPATHHPFLYETAAGPFPKLTTFFVSYRLISYHITRIIRLRMRLPGRYHTSTQDALPSAAPQRSTSVTNPYCDNCGLPETAEHRFLECPAYDQERNHLAKKVEYLNNGLLSLKALLRSRKMLDPLFYSLRNIGVAEII